ncbi:MAG TPA: hypothetical protein VE963_02195 [Reyranella sp.]|nr:hypothetical protein [Reyranella sp.]
MKVINRRTTLGTAGAVVAQATVPGAMAQAWPGQPICERGAGISQPALVRPGDILVMWKADYARYGKLVQEAGIKAES